VGHGKERNVGVDGFGFGIGEIQVREPFQVRVDHIEGSPCKLAGCGTDNFCFGMVREEADEFAACIPGCPDNRDFHGEEFLWL
jgi:hypothetical protein